MKIDDSVMYTTLLIMYEQATLNGYFFCDSVCVCGNNIENLCHC
jgi:hypothetical protein